jgi:hypothetical protein
MSEEKPATPAPAPASPKPEFGAPMTSFVRGGTISSRAEYELQAKRHDAETRRNAEAERHRIARTDPLNARMRVADLGSRENHAWVVLEFRNSDNKPEQFLTCELRLADQDDPTELMLCMICPKCALRVGSSEANFKFTNKHKKFDLDTRRAGEIWVNPLDPDEILTIAGTIFLHEVVTCPLNCGWRFKIDNSVVKTL